MLGIEPRSCAVAFEQSLPPTKRFKAIPAGLDEVGHAVPAPAVLQQPPPGAAANAAPSLVASTISAVLHCLPTLRTLDSNSFSRLSGVPCLQEAVKLQPRSLVPAVQLHGSRSSRVLHYLPEPTDCCRGPPLDARTTTRLSTPLPPPSSSRSRSIPAIARRSNLASSSLN